ncbi:MAG: hypothetical protein WBX25_32860 [Rhodomicrobium sp.]
MAQPMLSDARKALAIPAEGRQNIPAVYSAKSGFVWVEGGGVSYRRFRGANGTAEHFCMIDAPCEGSFTDLLRSLQERYEITLRT